MKRVFQEEQQAESLLHLILDKMGDAVVVVDTSERIVLVNPAACRMLGLKPLAEDPAQTLCAFDLLRSDGMIECPLAERPLARALRGETVDGFLGKVRPATRAREGAWVSANARPLFDTAGMQTGAMAVFHDITPLFEAKRALQRSQDDFRLLVEASVDYAIMMIDPDGFIRSWNSGAELIFGRAAQQAIGRRVVDIFTPEDLALGEPLREFEQAKTLGRSEDDRWHLRADGSRFWASGVVTALRADNGSLRGFVKILRDETPQRLAQEQTQFLANHDALTGLPNRVQFSNQLHNAIAASERSNVPFALLLLDLDRFKHVNDTFGHHAGDLLLKEVALRIVSSMRETDFVARLGGDEFVIVQRDVAQPEAAEGLARKLVLELGRPYRIDSQEIAGGASIGIGIYPGDARTSVELLKCADLALYRAKNTGRRTYQFHAAERGSGQSWRRNREAALRAAFEQSRFELYYQPQVDLQSWKISAVEALLRWRVSDTELVLPADFLCVAEESGLIVQLGEWALREACTSMRRWQCGGMGELRLSVNCSARQFGDPDFVARIPAILKETGMELSSLEIEVPETMFARHPEIRERLAELRAQGIRLAVDNFGAGTIALADFKDLEIDALKIDKIFVQHLPHRREDSAITAAIISLAHNLGIGVVAGGVETAEQLAYLTSRGCTGAQGFLFSPPLPADRLDELMRNGLWSRINAGLGGDLPPPPALR